MLTITTESKVATTVNKKFNKISVIYTLWKWQVADAAHHSVVHRMIN